MTKSIAKRKTKTSYYLRRQYFRKLLFSSAAFFLIPTLLWFMLFTANQRQASFDGWNADRQQTLSKVAQTLDTQLSSIIKIPGLLGANTLVNQFHLNTRDLSLHFDLRNLLNAYGETNALIGDLLLYPQGDHLLFSRNRTLLLAPENISVKVDGQNYVDVMMDESTMRTFQLKRIDTPYLQSGPSIVYTAPIYRKLNQITMICTIVLDSTAIAEAFASAFSTADVSAQVLIVDGGNACLFSIGVADPDEAVLRLTQAVDAYASQALVGGEAFYYHTAVSQVTDWQYCLLSPVKEVRAGMHTQALWFTLALPLLLALGGIALYLFVRINYLPIEDAYESAQQYARQTAPGALPAPYAIIDSRRRSALINELQFIQTAIEYMAIRESHISETATNHQQALRRIFWLDVLNGSFLSEEALLRRAGELGLNLPRRAYFVIILSHDGLEYADEVQTQLHQMLERLFDVFPLEAIHFPRMAFVCLLRDDTLTDSKTLCESLPSWLEAAARSLSANLFAGVGSLYRDYIHAPHSFFEAHTALDMHSILGSRLIFFEAIRGFIPDSESFDLQVDAFGAKLEEVVASGDIAAIHACMESLCDLLGRQQPPAITLRRICFDANTAAYNALTKADAKETPSLSLRLFETLFRIQSDSDAIAFLHDLKQAILRELEVKGGNHTDVSEMIEYIHAHYLRQSFSCTEVATHFGMQSSSFSRFFKQQTGLLPINYLTALRIEAAKEMLSTTDLPLSSIVTAVGYYSISSFIKRFREYEKKTPLEYRADNREGVI